MSKYYTKENGFKFPMTDERVKSFDIIRNADTDFYNMVTELITKICETRKLLGIDNENFNMFQCTGMIVCSEHLKKINRYNHILDYYLFLKVRSCQISEFENMEYFKGRIK